MNDHNPSEDKPTGPTERLTEGDPLAEGSEGPAAEADDAPDAAPAGEPGEASGAERPTADLTDEDAGRPATGPAAGASGGGDTEPAAGASGGGDTEPADTLAGGWVPPGGGYSPRAHGGAAGSGDQWSRPAPG